MTEPAPSEVPPEPPPPESPPPSVLAPEELAARLAARLCHDFISPASAIVSGLDLLDDPAAKDMRDDAMALIATSARKLTDLLQFCRVAFGASASADAFDSVELEGLARGVFAHSRAELEWAIAPQTLPKTAGRALMNMVQLAGGALPLGGAARAEVLAEGDGVVVRVVGRSPRARLHAEVADGLAGQPLGEGLAGRWVQAYYLHSLVRSAGGQASAEMGDEIVTFEAALPA